MDEKVPLIVFLSLFSTLVHSIAFSLLWRAKRVINRYNRSQGLYLLHLSFTETLYSVSSALRILARLTDRSNAELWIFFASIGTFIQLTLILISMTVDRYLALRYSLKYLLIWKKKKTKIIIAFIYTANILFTVLTINYVNNLQEDCSISSQFAWLPLDGAFLFFSLFWLRDAYYTKSHDKNFP